jgi:hypothetical protein
MRKTITKKLLLFAVLRNSHRATLSSFILTSLHYADEDLMERRPSYGDLLYIKTLGKAPQEVVRLYPLGQDEPGTIL